MYGGGCKQSTMSDPILEPGQVWRSLSEDLDPQAIFNANRGRWTSDPPPSRFKPAAPMRRGKVPNAAAINVRVRAAEKPPEPKETPPAAKLPPKLQTKLNRDMRELESRLKAKGAIV